MLFFIFYCFLISPSFSLVEMRGQVLFQNESLAYLGNPVFKVKISLLFIFNTNHFFFIFNNHFYLFFSSSLSMTW